MLDELRRFDVPALDDLLCGGLTPGEVWCIEGAPGAGKTLLGLHFLAAGIAAGEPGLYITAAETPARTVQFFARCWPDLEAAIKQQQLAVLDPSPFFTELRLAKERRTRDRVDTWDEVWRFVQDMTRQSRNQGARRIVIDPLTPLLLAHESTIDLWDTVQMLVGALGENLGATTLLTHAALAHPDVEAVGAVLRALCGGMLRLDTQREIGPPHVIVHALKRRYAPLAAAAVTLTIGADAHLHAPSDVLHWEAA
jgi:KaiC/GvpD/RAD55 family RecA-like ATPase